MPTSQNGWKANDYSLIEPLIVGGVPFPAGCRKGDIHTIFTWLAKEFSRTVEPLHKGWCWGYAERPIRGHTATLSNHGSGTALDFNAPDHPLGTDPRSNYTNKEINAIDKLLSRLTAGKRHVVRWGGDYSGRKDGMHFEFIGDAHDADNLAKKLTKEREEDVFDFYNSMAIASPQELKGATKVRLDREYADAENTHEGDEPSIIHGPAHYLSGIHGRIQDAKPGEIVEIFAREAWWNGKEWKIFPTNVAYETCTVSSKGNTEFACSSLPNFLANDARLWWYVNSSQGELIECQVTCLFN